jgi:hypothetical protein
LSGYAPISPLLAEANPLHDLLRQVNSFLRSLLFHLEVRLSLPLGCDEAGTIHLNTSTRTAYTFFLAEMSLKTIIARIPTTPDLDYSVPNTLHTNAQISPLVQEPKTQIDGWGASLPNFLGWSAESNKGAAFSFGTRLRLLCWFAQFSLFKPHIIKVLHDFGL